jgi:hypothetical protein
MFGTHFYHKRVRTAVSVFGSLFNNIHVIRQNKAGGVISQIKVPLAYAQRRQFLSRIEEMEQGQDAERKVAIKLPRMSFEITNMVYDAARQLPKMNAFTSAVNNSVVSRQKLYSATPYIVSFQLNVYAKNQDDALQIVEQILPYFSPQYTVTVKPFADIPTLKEDVPINLGSVVMYDDFEGELQTRRTIVYSLDFDMKILLHGPVNSDGEKIIRDVRTNYFLQTADSDQYLHTTVQTPEPNTVSVDSDYGFSIEYLDEQA